MAKHYREAYESGEQTDSYAFNNWAFACLLLAHLEPAYEQGEWRGALADMCEAEARKAIALGEDDPSLWRTTGLADLEVVRLLLAANDDGACTARATRAAALYAAAFERGASLREIASVQDNLDFLIELTAEWPPGVAAALSAIRNSL
jgi:hypothetical protein